MQNIDSKENNFIRDYGQKLQYRTMRRVFTPSPELRKATGLLNLPVTVTALVRFDDDCRNGHCTFSVSGSYSQGSGRNKRGGGGQITQVIAEAFPVLAPLLKWGLWSTDGGLHYAANAVYLAGDRDCHGHRAGEPSSFSNAVRFGGNPIKHKLGMKFVEFLKAHAPEFDFEVLAIEHRDAKMYSSKYTFGGYADKWYECPFDTEPEALDFLRALQTHSPTFLEVATAWSTGKIRELDAARRTANWPDATDEELSAEPDVLRARLLERLPALLVEFRAAVESLGFDYEFPANSRKE
jgi:hypothetical protein